MDKFIGFDIDHKHTLACVVQAGQPDRYRKLRTDVGQLLTLSIVSRVLRRSWTRQGTDRGDLGPGPQGAE